LHDRAGEERRLRDAINAAIDGGAPPPPRARRNARPQVEFVEPDHEAEREWTAPYEVAVGVEARTPYTLDDPAARPELLRVIEHVVRQEGPVDIDRVMAAVKDAWAVRRAGHRIQAAFEDAVTTLSRSKLELRFERFLVLPGHRVVKVRIPVPGKPKTIRSVRELPPDELDLAVLNLSREAVSVPKDELIILVSRLFGWQRTTPEIEGAVDRSRRRLSEAGLL